MFTTWQQDQFEFSSSEAPAVFSDVVALQAAGRRLSGEHSVPKSKKPKISRTKQKKQLSTQKRAQRVNASVVKEKYARSQSDNSRVTNLAASKNALQLMQLTAPGRTWLHKWVK